MRSGDEVMMDIFASMEQMPPGLERAGLATQIFGRRWEQIAPLLGRGTDGIARLRAEAHELGAVMDRESLEAADSYRRAMERLQAQLTGAGRAIAVDLMPVVEKLIPVIQEKIKVVTDLIRRFTQMDERSQRLAFTIAGVAAAIGPALLAIKAFGMAVAAALSPMAMKIAAIGSLVLALNYLRRNWSSTSAWIADDWNRTVNDMIYTSQLLLRALDVMVSFLDPLNVGLKPVIASMENFKREIPDREDGYGFESLGEFMKGTLQDFGNMFDWISGKLFTFEESIESVSESGKEIARDFGEPIKSVTVDVMMFNTELSNTARLVREVSTEAKQMPEHLRSAYNVAVEGLNEVSTGMRIAESMAIDFTNSFGQGMANVVVQGERLVDVLKNIGRLLLSQGIQTAIRLLLGGSGLATGGSVTGGLFGRVFGGASGMAGAGGVISNNLFLDSRQIDFSLQRVNYNRNR
jgi:methyl-accepting chemotaxis protein